MITTLKYKTFYKKLGNLLFAIAAADKKISKKETEALDELVQYHWKHLEETTDRFGTEGAFLIQFQFETLADGIVDPEHAYLSFEHYFHEHEPDIDASLRRKIFDSALLIAERVRGINHQELEYMVRLKNLLQV